jgi:hypothetical protein
VEAVEENKAVSGVVVSDVLVLAALKFGGPVSLAIPFDTLTPPLMTTPPLMVTCPKESEHSTNMVARYLI